MYSPLHSMLENIWSKITSWCLYLTWQLVQMVKRVSGNHKSKIYVSHLTKSQPDRWTFGLWLPLTCACMQHNCIIQILYNYYKQTGEQNWISTVDWQRLDNDWLMCRKKYYSEGKWYQTWRVSALVCLVTKKFNKFAE